MIDNRERDTHKFENITQNSWETVERLGSREMLRAGKSPCDLRERKKSGKNCDKKERGGEKGKGGSPGRICNLFRVYTVWRQLHASFTYKSTYSPKGASYPPPSFWKPVWTWLSQPCSREVVGVMTVILYLWAIYFMVDHKQEHYSTDGLHYNGAIVHLLPVRRMLTQGS